MQDGIMLGKKAMHVESKIIEVQRTIQIEKEQSIVKLNNL